MPRGTHHDGRHDGYTVSACEAAVPANSPWHVDTGNQAALEHTYERTNVEYGALGGMGAFQQAYSRVRMQGLPWLEDGRSHRHLC